MLVRRSVVESTNGFDESFFGVLRGKLTGVGGYGKRVGDFYGSFSAEIIHYGGESNSSRYRVSRSSTCGRVARFTANTNDRTAASGTTYRAGLTRSVQETLPELKNGRLTRGEAVSWLKTAPVWHSLQIFLRQRLILADHSNQASIFPAAQTASAVSRTDHNYFDL